MPTFYADYANIGAPIACAVWLRNLTEHAPVSNTAVWVLIASDNDAAIWTSDKGTSRLVRVVRHVDTVYTLDVESGFGQKLIDRLQRFVLRSKVSMRTSDWVVRAFRGAGAAVEVGAVQGRAVALLGEGVGDEAVVGGVGGGGEQAAVEEDTSGVVIDLVLVATPSRDLDDDVDAAGCRFVGHVAMVAHGHGVHTGVTNSVHARSIASIASAAWNSPPTERSSRW